MGLHLGGGGGGGKEAPFEEGKTSPRGEIPMFPPFVSIVVYACC